MAVSCGPSTMRGWVPANVTIRIMPRGIRDIAAQLVAVWLDDLDDRALHRIDAATLVLARLVVCDRAWQAQHRDQLPDLGDAALEDVDRDDQLVAQWTALAIDRPSRARQCPGSNAAARRP